MVLNNRERLVVLPPPLAELAHRRLAEQQTSLIIREARFDVPRTR
jgi:hypothetical protein